MKLMELNKTVLAAVMILGSVSATNAADSGSGTVTFSGAIVDAPCSIRSDTANQTVDLGQISNSALAANGQTGTSRPQPFTIVLEHCDNTTLRTVQTTFTGPSSDYDAESLALRGNASGASIVLHDGNDKKVKLGVPTDQQWLYSGINVLNFSAYLQGGGTSAIIVPGQFQSVANFTLAYQ